MYFEFLFIEFLFLIKQKKKKKKTCIERIAVGSYEPVAEFIFLYTWMHCQDSNFEDCCFVETFKTVGNYTRGADRFNKVFLCFND